MSLCIIRNDIHLLIYSLWHCLWANEVCHLVQSRIPPSVQMLSSTAQGQTNNYYGMVLISRALSILMLPGESALTTMGQNYKVEWEHTFIKLPWLILFHKKFLGKQNNKGNSVKIFLQKNTGGQGQWNGFSRRIVKVVDTHGMQSTSTGPNMYNLSVSKLLSLSTF